MENEEVKVGEVTVEVPQEGAEIVQENVEPTEVVSEEPKVEETVNE